MSSSAGSATDRLPDDPLRELIATEVCLHDIISRARDDAAEMLRAAREKATAMEEALAEELERGRGDRLSVIETQLAGDLSRIESDWRAGVAATERALLDRSESLADLVAARALESDPPAVGR